MKFIILIIYLDDKWMFVWAPTVVLLLTLYFTYFAFYKSCEGHVWCEQLLTDDDNTSFKD